MQFNRGQISEALSKYFGIKGDFGPVIDKTIVPVVSVGDLTDAPYPQFAIPVVGQSAQTAVAAEFAAVIATPSATVSLQIQQMVFKNTAAAEVDILVNAMTDAQFNTGGFAAANNFRALGLTFGDGRPSIVFIGTHTSILGTTLFRITVPANSSLVLPLPGAGITLEPGMNLAAWQEVANTDLDNVAFFGREWPRAG